MASAAGTTGGMRGELVDSVSAGYSESVRCHREWEAAMRIIQAFGALAMLVLFLGFGMVFGAKTKG
ncbi:MAG: hypothetical protein HW405_674 [Candidatus Berkelbacteria bacterium]|nr:hypothetical protein [Candidatus Berkelbacteria bacterium]